MKIVEILQPTKPLWWWNKKTVSKLRPYTDFGKTWEASTGSHGIWLQNVIDYDDSTHAGAVAAINQIRAQFSLPPLDLAPPQPKKALSPKTLLHGTGAATARRIMRKGLEPRRGAFLQGAHGDHAEPLVYAATLRDIHRVVAAAFVASDSPSTDAAFFASAAILVLPNDGEWYRAGRDTVDPIGVESGDFYRRIPIMPTRALMGDDLRAFFAKRVGGLPSDFIDFIDPD